MSFFNEPGAGAGKRRYTVRYYDADKEDVLRELGSCHQGLSGEEAAARLARNGKNRLAEAPKDSLVKRFFAQMADPMIIILLAAAAISGVTSFFSNESFADSIIILFVVIVNAVLGVYQENKAEKAIEALQEMSAAESRVIRDGRLQRILSEDLVAGDVVLLEAGDAVPADGRLLESASLRLEEAALTGESVPVTKFIELIGAGEGPEVPLGDRRNMVYMGSTVAYGRGSFVVTATGMATEMGKIAHALTETKEGQTPLQLKLAQLSRILTKLVLAICAVIFGVGLLRAGSFNGEVVLNTFMVAVSLAVAAIPEGLVAVVTIVLSVGVTNMSRRNAIIRRLTAVETLGCAQIICSDKTGTLTQNRMTVVRSWGGNDELLAAAMALCSDAEYDEAEAKAIGEPTEAALVNWAASLGMPKDGLKAAQPRVGEAPFDSIRKMMSTVHLHEGGCIQYTKGAPDEVLRKCTHVLRDGAVLPLVYWMQPPSCRWTVLIILRRLSKGASPTRGWADLRSSFGWPREAAQLTSAASVGSPTALASTSSYSASEHRAMAVASSSSLPPQLCTTVMRFWVRVPVLSEQMIWAQPKVSTAVRRRMMARRRLMLVTPMDSTMVTTATRPSGMAATARDTATMKVFSTTSPLRLPVRMRPTAKMTTQMASTSLVRMRESWASFSCSGVWPSLVWVSAWAILPISVSMPVPVTTKLPRP